MKKKYTIPKILGKLLKDSFKNIRIHFVAYMMFGVIGGLFAGLITLTNKNFLCSGRVGCGRRRKQCFCSFAFSGRSITVGAKYYGVFRLVYR